MLATANHPSLAQRAGQGGGEQKKNTLPTLYGTQVGWVGLVGTSLVRKSAPMVALYWLLNFLFTYWFMREVFPTPLSPRMMTFNRTFLRDAMATNWLAKTLAKTLVRSVRREERTIKKKKKTYLLIAKPTQRRTKQTPPRTMAAYEGCANFFS